MNPMYVFIAFAVLVCIGGAIYLARVIYAQEKREAKEMEQALRKGASRHSNTSEEDWRPERSAEKTAERTAERPSRFNNEKPKEKTNPRRFETKRRTPGDDDDSLPFGGGLLGASSMFDSPSVSSFSSDGGSFGGGFDSGGSGGGFDSGGGGGMDSGGGGGGDF